MYLKSETDRFFRKTTPVTESGCLLWTGASNKQGYGQFWVSGKNKRAHRVAWELEYGEISEGLLVCHKCDVPQCVNHNHLFVGSCSDNAWDMSRKGRSLKGRIFKPESKVYLKSDIRISVRVGENKTRKIELIRQPYGDKFWVRVDKRRSKKLDEATVTEITDKLRRWIVRMT